MRLCLARSRAGRADAAAEAPCPTSACVAAQGMSVGILGAIALQEELAGRLAAARGDGAATVAALTGLAKVSACGPVQLHAYPIEGCQAQGETRRA
jgi:hypothetical protein